MTQASNISELINNITRRIDRLTDLTTGFDSNDSGLRLVEVGLGYWHVIHLTNGQLDNTNDQPAVTVACGSRYYFKEGLLHRLERPAVAVSNGSKEYWENGKLHNLKEPAIQYVSGLREWFIEGERITDPTEIEYLENGAHILQLAIADNL